MELKCRCGETITVNLSDAVIKDAVINRERLNTTFPLFECPGCNRKLYLLATSEPPSNTQLFVVDMDAAKQPLILEPTIRLLDTEDMFKKPLTKEDLAFYDKTKEDLKNIKRASE